MLRMININMVEELSITGLEYGRMSAICLDLQGYCCIQNDQLFLQKVH